MTYFSNCNKSSLFRARNPLSGEDQHLILIPSQFLQNTLEQVIITSVGLLVLTTYLDAHQMSIIPAISIQFVVGRAVFWWGYNQADVLKRVYGFAMIFPLNAVLYVYLTYKFLKHECF